MFTPDSLTPPMWRLSKLSMPHLRDCRKQLEMFAHSLYIFVSSFDVLTKLLRLTPKVPAAPLSTLLQYPGISPLVLHQ